ncbi:hypothetical protein HaLaN_27271, partial [Haematococcus lacustris]
MAATAPPLSSETTTPLTLLHCSRETVRAASVAASTTRKALVTKFAQAALTPTAKAGVPAAQRRAIAVLRERRLQALEEKDASRRGGESGATDASED